MLLTFFYEALPSLIEKFQPRAHDMSWAGEEEQGSGLEQLHCTPASPAGTLTPVGRPEEHWHVIALA